jgi:uncharacterized Fe-S center protein
MQLVRVDDTSCVTCLLDLPVDMIRVILRGINVEYETLVEIMSCLSKNWYEQMKKEWSEIRVMETHSLSQKRVIRMKGLTSLCLSMNKKITDITSLTQLTSLKLKRNETIHDISTLAQLTS